MRCPEADERSCRESCVGGVPGKPPRFAGRVKQFGAGRMVERPVHSKAARRAALTTGECGYGLGSA